MKRQYLPALRGLFGDWVYYSCLMPMSDVVNRVQFADEIHKSKKLSDMIQRRLSIGRGKEIANYLLNEEQRFFNSLVVALYGGKPSWHGFENFRALQDDIDLEDISNDAKNSLGFLSFTGDEKIFAIDGQHRLAGMREAVKSKSELGTDEVPLIFVAHRETEEGRIRTRKLFTTLNKTARPVGKGEIIALDECDVMAIVTRHLIENHEFFKEDRILFVQSSNMPPTNITEFTTIGNIYDVLTIVFTKIKETKRSHDLKFFRPSDEKLDEYIQFADIFFRGLAEAFPALKEYFTSDKDSKVIEKYRNKNGGNVLFRPVGLQIFTEVISTLTAQKLPLKKAIELAAKLPTELNDNPYVGVIWLASSMRMNPKEKVLARRLLLYMLSRESKPKELQAMYAKQLGVDISDCQLPEKLLSD